MDRDDRPSIAITMGDPAGIGPEIVAKSLANPMIHSICRPIVIGDETIMRHAANASGISIRASNITSLGDHSNGITVYDPWQSDLSDIPLGKVTSEAGEAAAKSVIEATRLAMQSVVEAIVTAPINKAAINAAGYHYAGHTELLGELTKSPGARMLLVAPGLRVIHNSTHVSLKEAIARVTLSNVLHVIRLMDDSLQLLEIEKRRIAVCGLNPHAGEGGLFGDEDQAIIGPAIEAARHEGIDVSGPEPADTVFHQAKNGEFDGVVAMYHDQGHIAVKVAGFFDGINVSVGLPIIRTSVDHGTAFDIAGQNIARADSMDLAVITAATMALSKRQTASTMET